jgi:nicotinamidase-related amidase
MIQFGNSTNYWIQSNDIFDISRGAKKKYLMKSMDYRLAFDPERTALVITDMQNFFLSEKLNRNHAGSRLIDPISTAVQKARSIGMKIIWINWGIRSDMVNIPPGTSRIFYHAGTELGKDLPNNLGLNLVKGSWSAEIIPELLDKVQTEDILIDKNRVSGFSGTELLQTLVNLDIKTMVFAGINTDQCVMATLQDAHSYGYDCILLEDCTATSSPPFAYQTVIFNVKKMGFISNSDFFCNGEYKYNEIDSWVSQQINYKA